MLDKLFNPTRQGWFVVNGIEFLEGLVFIDPLVANVFVDFVMDFNKPSDKIISRV